MLSYWRIPCPPPVSDEPAKSKSLRRRWGGVAHSSLEVAGLPVMIVVPVKTPTLALLTLTSFFAGLALTLAIGRFWGLVVVVYFAAAVFICLIIFLAWRRRSGA